MRFRVPVVLGFLAGSLASASVVAAQQKPNVEPASRREGFWLGIGLAAGSAGLDCSGCSGDRESGGSGYVRMGGTLSPHWLLGGEIDGWAKSQAGLDMVMANVAITASWYPSHTGGFFLKFGLGGMAYQEDDGINKSEAAGGSAIIGVGFDLAVGPHTSLTPFLNSIATSGSKVKLNGTTVGGLEMNPNLVQVGLAISFH